MFQHFALRQFWHLYHQLPKEVQDTADKSFALLQTDSKHPSLHFKKTGTLWSARVGRGYRALAYQNDEGFVWFWIGSHSEYDKFMP